MIDPTMIDPADYLGEDEELEKLRALYRQKMARMGAIGQADSSLPRFLGGAIDAYSAGQAGEAQAAAIASGQPVRAIPTPSAAGVVDRSLAMRREKALGDVTMFKNLEDLARRKQEKALEDAAKAKAAAKGKGSGGGKMLPASVAQEAGMAKAAIAALDDVSGEMKKYGDISGPWAGRLSGALGSFEIGETGKRAAAFDAVLRQRAQVIGKYLEGGKLAEGDIGRYVKQLPQLSDSDEVKQSKIASLQRLIAQKQQQELDTLQSAGYNTASIGRVAAPGFKDVSGTKQKPQSVLDAEKKFGVKYEWNGTKWQKQKK